MITHDELTRLLNYNKVTGEFTWVSDRGRVKSGATAGAVRKDGYLHIVINRKVYLAHRLAWFYVMGEWPEDQIDHVNKNRGDNRICNLRQATNKQNGENIPLLSSNTSGHRGVTWSNERQKWVAQVKHHGKTIRVGRYDSLEAAAEAAKNARLRLFTHCNE